MNTKLNKVMFVIVALAASQAQAGGPTWEPGGTRCVPNFRKERQVGYICTRVEPGSLYARTGLRSGEAVTAINGKSLATDLNAAIDLWKEFEKNSESTLTVERDGKRLELKRPASGH